MSITVRLWSKAELKGILDHTLDKNLITVFMNGHTFSWDEISVYPYDIRKTYEIKFNGQSEKIMVYAVDEESLFWFLSKEYRNIPDCLKSVTEITETKRKVKIPSSK
jgi:hypothetical protein